MQLRVTTTKKYATKKGDFPNPPNEFLLSNVFFFVTIQELEREIKKSGLIAKVRDLDVATGSLIVDISGIDGHSKATFIPPYKELDNPGLPQILVQLYFAELSARRQNRLGAKKQKQ